MGYARIRAKSPSANPESKRQSVITGRVLRKRKAQPEVTATNLEISKDSDLITLLPDVGGHPPAWADCRPALADAIPWFRSVQGGVYHNGSLCWGFLLDADCGVRSYMDDEIIITRVGGGCTKNADGKLTLIKDQDSENTIVKSIINSKNLNLPVGMIIGDRNTLLGRKVPHRYNVMAFFRVSQVWYEKIGNKTGARVRFEKLDLSSKSWWASKGSPDPLPLENRNFSLEPETRQCLCCARTSSQVYNEGWMCLNPDCTLFWTLDGTSPPVPLTYHARFLESRLPPDPKVDSHHSLIPSLLSTLNELDHDSSLQRIAWKGIVCPQCSKCIARRFWCGWKCTDSIDLPGRPQSGCTFEKTLTIHPISLRSVVDEFELSPIKRAIFFDPKFAIPEVDDLSVHPYRKFTYRIPGAGSIVHLVSNRTINSQPNGPNDLFTQLQAVDHGLRRYPLQQSVVAGTLTSHFAVNYGIPYKYVVSVDSKAFDEASDAILRGLGRLTWATKEAVHSVGDQGLSPNELLLLGYFEDMKIGYHDDGEESLGPTIATLSLGAKSTMLIRMKYKYHHGFSKAKKLLDEDPVIDSCEFFNQRLNLKQRLNAGSIGRSEYDALRRDLFRKSKNGDARPLIKMELNHGDLVVMHGEKLQKYFEHSVMPEKKLRFALTARHIKPEDVDPKEWPKGNFTLTPDQIYDGK